MDRPHWGSREGFYQLTFAGRQRTLKRVEEDEVATRLLYYMSTAVMCYLSPQQRVDFDIRLFICKRSKYKQETSEIKITTLLHR